MKKIVIASLIVLLLPLTAFAQTSTATASDMPRFNLFGGYSYLRSNTLPPEVVGDTNNSGWTASFTANMNHWFGVIGSVAGQYGSPTLNNLVDPTTQTTTTRPYTYTFMAGPQVTVPTDSRVKPFADVLVGLAHQRAVSSADLVTPVTGNGMALSFGGGVDIAVHPSLAVRAAQLQYLQTRAFSQSQNTWTLSTGVVYRF